MSLRVEREGNGIPLEGLHVKYRKVEWIMHEREHDMNV